MAKHTQKICRQQATSCLIVFDHFAGLGLSKKNPKKLAKVLQEILQIFLVQLLWKASVNKRGI